MDSSGTKKKQSPVHVVNASHVLASTLHEIRTPIQTIVSTTELLQDTNLDREQTEYVHQIEFSANALLELANDVLDFTKIQSNNFKLENVPFDLISLVERVVDLVTVEAFNKKLEVVTDIDYLIPKMVMGDPVRVQQVILNLVKNAVKFTHQGFIVVKLSLKNNYFLFEVVDYGIGVDKQKQELIFSDFYQVDASTTRKYGGSGLGLAISKNLVEAMKGKIGIYSDGQLGSNFYFTLPAVKAEFEPPPLEIDAEDGRVLIVDDSRLFNAALAKKIKAFGIKDIVQVYSGEEALEVLKQEAENGRTFTAAFIDLVMPVMDGWRLASEIKRISDINATKLYLMVPEGQLKGEAKMKLLNWFNGYIYKPIKREALFSLLREAFAQKIQPEEEKHVNALSELRLNDCELAKGKTILVAEDHPVNRRMISIFLERFGAKVLLAEDGEQAVNVVKENPFIDLIFMDILMPVKTGIDATVELRQLSYKGIIIACTANNDPDDFATYRNLGINDILLKPFKREGIRQILEKWFTVLSFPEAKMVMTLTGLNNQADGFWDISDFMDTVSSNTELAVSLMVDYINQTEVILSKLKTELSGEKDPSKIELYAHTLKGSSAGVSATRLAETGKRMDDAAKAKDFLKVEALFIDFSLDFVKFRKIVEVWKAAL